MNEKLARNDQEIHDYLMQKRFPGGVMKCPECDCLQAYRLGTGRYRCAGKKYTFNFATGTWLARVKISAPKWLELVRAYDVMNLHSVAARLAKTSNATARRAFGVISEAICLHQRQENENVKFRTQDTGHRTQDTGHRTQDTGHRTQDTGHRTQDTGHGGRTDDE